jgi:hypothetical protein
VVKVRNDAGLVGWTLVDENFDDADMDALDGRETVTAKR